MNKKAFIWPVWMMATITLISILFSFVSEKTFRSTYHIEHLKPVTLFFLIVVPALLLIETILYYSIRWRIDRPLWARLHIWLTFFAVVVVRAMFLLRAVMVIMHRSPSSALVSYTQVYLFWLALLLGQAFFAALVMRSFTVEEPVPDAGNTEANLLDDILEE